MKIVTYKDGNGGDKYRIKSLVSESEISEADFRNSAKRKLKEAICPNRAIRFFGENSV